MWARSASSVANFTAARATGVARATAGGVTGAVAATAATAAAAVWVLAAAERAREATAAEAPAGAATEGTIWLVRTPATPRRARREAARKVVAFVVCISLGSL